LADELTTEALLRRCRKRPPDEAAWQEFVRRYHSVIKANVVRYFHLKAGQEFERRSQVHEDSIEDLVQTVYLRLIDDNSRVLKAFHGELENSILAYLTMISVNVVKDHFRGIKADKRPKIIFSLDELIENEGEGRVFIGASSDIHGNQSGSKQSGSPSPAFAIEDIDALLNKALSHRNRDRNTLIFKLRYCDGLTLEEIRNTLGLDMSSLGIGSILSRINKQLRQIIQEKSGRGK
jgi:RNA polymerase sigma factor (sigma-70 family)